ncbi:MAG: nucleotidyl transferase AbiEii/AbiGii toxin family protein [Alcanivorax sp.]|jgi:hypothetical protein
MFDHPHHRKIHHILTSLDSSLFVEAGACFGGGTLISLLHGEYRWSKDIDFLCPVGSGYRTLRKAVMEATGKPEFLFKKTTGLEFPRDIKADQYGIRFLVVADDTPIKFEIVCEARIDLGSPEQPDWLNIPCLSTIDRYAEKLLANADRWNDSSIESRDLIDLAVLRLNEGPSEQAIAKAEDAYPVLVPLENALKKFQGSDDYRRKCFNALEVRNKALVLDGIDLLASDQELPVTQRLRDELHC